MQSSRTAAAFSPNHCDALLNLEYLTAQGDGRLSEGGGGEAELRCAGETGCIEYWIQVSQVAVSHGAIKPGHGCSQTRTRLKLTN